MLADIFPFPTFMESILHICKLKLGTNHKKNKEKVTKQRQGGKSGPHRHSAGILHMRVCTWARVHVSVRICILHMRVCACERMHVHPSYVCGHVSASACERAHVCFFFLKHVRVCSLPFWPPFWHPLVTGYFLLIDKSIVAHIKTELGRGKEGSNLPTWQPLHIPTQRSDYLIISKSQSMWRQWKIGKIWTQRYTSQKLHSAKGKSPAVSRNNLEHNQPANWFLFDLTTQLFCTLWCVCVCVLKYVALLAQRCPETASHWLMTPASFPHLWDMFTRGAKGQTVQHHWTHRCRRGLWQTTEYAERCCVSSPA